MIWLVDKLVTVLDMDLLSANILEPVGTLSFAMGLTMGGVGHNCF